MVEGSFIMGNVDRSFKSAYFKESEKSKFNHIGHSLARFEFWELLVRIAV